MKENNSTKNTTKKDTPAITNTKLDYKKLGLKSGLEIHQQLEGKKLFCNCPTIITEDDDYSFEVTRKLRAVVGETGEIDNAAAHEMKKQKKYIYRANPNSCCLVELDEAPPKNINPEAVKTTLQIAKMFNSDVVDEVQIMRKIVINGSNTSGFQRTALVAEGGSFETSEGKIRISSVAVEEDSSKEIEKTSDHTIFNLSRLGIPLIEIATEPDIRSPQQCKEAAEKIGMFLRSTGRVKRGLGTIRQDVNVSIAEGERVEIKGAQDLNMIPTYVEYEVIRQISLLEIKKDLGNYTLDKNVYDITKLLEKSQSKIIVSTLKKKGVIKALRMPGFTGFLGRETQPGKRLGSELSDYGKVRAGVGGLFHSDELPKYGITQEEVDAIRKELKCKKSDGFILVADEENKVDNALDAVIYRAELIKNGVLQQVRKANVDGTTSYLRPMPGAARMYPETDTLPITTNLKNIELPELIDDKAIRFVKEYSLGKDLARDIAKSGDGEIFEEFFKKYSNIKPAFIAETTFSTPKVLRRKHNVDDSLLTYKDFENIFNKLNKNEITKDCVEEILIAICKKETIDYSKYSPLSNQELEKIIKQSLEENKNLPFNAVIGKIMGKLKGKAEGKIIMGLITKIHQ